MRVKICGCRSVEVALAAADAGADFVGLMFAPSSKRRIELEDASEIVRALGTPLSELELQMPPAAFRTEAVGLGPWFEHGASALDRLLERKRPLTVGVFAGNDPDEINEIVDECGIDLIQFSGGEPWGACLLANRQVIKAVHVLSEDDAASAMSRMEVGSAMAVLLDKAHEAAFGGKGEAFDWSIATAIADKMPVWLAGGLTPETVAEAIGEVRPWAVDVSSGVETDGAKDIAKIRAFIAGARGAG
ncbi:MAG TPA: phosphoribosylanthranilate isomerase [Dehalococcoidia bacterium]|nr:phosphoribosylanthranilate isomerase [Dehalococcoidia bacterium]